MTIEFLKALYRGAVGYIELRTMATLPVFAPVPISGATEAVIEAHLAALQQRPDCKPFFGVAVRREATHGRSDNCSAITAVWADIDFKTHPESAFTAFYAEAPYKPSIVVATGGGVHCYWLLDEPLTDMGRAARLLTSWGATVPLSDPVFDVARVLRLPGTLNFKYDPPRKAELWIFDPDRRYSADELAVHARQKAVERGESVPEVGVIAPAFRLPESVGQGERHGALYRFLRSLQSRYGLAWEEVWPVVREVNRRRCTPPLSEAELRRYAWRAYHSPDRPEFRRLVEVVDETPALELADDDEPITEVVEDLDVREIVE